MFCHPFVLQLLLVVHSSVTVPHRLSIFLSASVCIRLMALRCHCRVCANTLFNCCWLFFSYTLFLYIFLLFFSMLFFSRFSSIQFRAIFHLIRISFLSDKAIFFFYVANFMCHSLGLVHYWYVNSEQNHFFYYCCWLLSLILNTQHISFKIEFYRFVMIEIGLGGPVLAP